MSEINILEVDINLLFENYNISEIDEIQRRIQTVVETKREDLRTIVSEKYRDLLKAADTIIEMKDTSILLIPDVQQITENCQKLNEKQLIGFKTERKFDKAVEKQLSLYYVTVEQIKILTLIPNLIWEHLYAKEYFIGAQLYILGRHINTGLQLNTKNSFKHLFPVAEYQWKYQIEEFYSTIKEYAIQALDNEVLSAETAIDSLLTLYLLDKTVGNNILKIFLDIRAKTYSRCLKNKDSKQKRVKDRIITSLNILISTINLLYECFFNNDPLYDGMNLLEYKIMHLTKYPTINLIEFGNVEMKNLLPDIIAKFRPNIDVPKISKDVVEPIITDWLNHISDIANVDLQLIIELITSMKIIKEIKKEASTVVNSTDWATKCKKCYLSENLNFYADKYQPLINNRVREIINQTWIKCNENIIENLCNALKDHKHLINNNKSIWTENSADIPMSLKDVLCQNREKNKLLMKIRGYDSSIIPICVNFDAELKELFDETNILLQESLNNKKDDRLILLDNLKDTSGKQTIELINMIQKINIGSGNEEFFLFVAKLFTSFIEICPHFKLCLSYSLVDTEISSNNRKKDDLEKWNKISSQIKEESLRYWKKYCDYEFNKFIEIYPLRKDITQTVLLQDLVNWDVFEMEENINQTKTETSTIRVPPQPRISLQTFIFEIIKYLHQRIPEGLPTTVMNYFKSLMINYFFQFYREVISLEVCSSNQNLALQLYFDLKFIKTIFITRNEVKFSEDFNKLTNILKNYIDPFDFELLHPYIAQNVNKCCQRLQQEFGSLLINNDQLKSKIISNKIESTNEKDPNILILGPNGSNTAWFPLLPVATSSSHEAKNQSFAESKTDLKKIKQNASDSSKSQSVQNYAYNVKTGAAAFFGAMSQDWFR